MEKFFEKRTTTLDTSQPGIRHIQQLIRDRTPVSLLLMGGTEVEGVVLWQDVFYLGVQHEDGRPLVLVNRSMVCVLRALG
ncbi:MAG: Hfq-related RNA-binding protein [Synechococcus sp.]